MTKAFSVLSWNVEHFGKTTRNSSVPKKPVAPIIDLIASTNADVVAIYEVVGKDIFDDITAKMPNYHFHITEGLQTQEILVGVKSNLASFFTQKTEFKAGSQYLRPGALLTVTKNGIQYPLLFLHLKSMSDPKGFGLRDDMTEKALKFKKLLDKRKSDRGEEGKSNFIFLGDLNTMGLNITYANNDMSADEEIVRLDKRLSARTVKMKRLSKTHEGTYWPGSDSSYSIGNLDHVIAAAHLEFKQYSGKSIKVSGWVDKSSNSAKDNWAEKYSDHALLYFEVQEPT